jgi:hypothetical protein
MTKTGNFRLEVARDNFWNKNFGNSRSKVSNNHFFQENLWLPMQIYLKEIQILHPFHIPLFNRWLKFKRISRDFVISQLCRNSRQHHFEQERWMGGDGKTRIRRILIDAMRKNVHALSFHVHVFLRHVKIHLISIQWTRSMKTRSSYLKALTDQHFTGEKAVSSLCTRLRSKTFSHDFFSPILVLFLIFMFGIDSMQTLR